MSPDVSLRAAQPEDVPALAFFMNECSRAEYGSSEVSEEEIRTWFTAPGRDLTEQSWVAVDPSGAICGYVDCERHDERGTRVWIDLRLHPEGHEAVGRLLLEAAEARAHVEAAGVPLTEDVLVRSVGPSPNVLIRRLLESAGYRPVRHSFRMEIELREPPEPPTWPRGIGVRLFQLGADDRAVYEAQQEAFRDSWDFQPEPYDEWRHYLLESELADPGLYFVAVEGDEIAGFSLCRLRIRDGRELGWVWLLGVRRPWRRRGLGLALLRHSFGEFHGRGIRRVGLGVDAASPTGAVGLYERAGMRVVQRRDTYEKPLVRLRP